MKKQLSLEGVGGCSVVGCWGKWTSGKDGDEGVMKRSLGRNGIECPPGHCLVGSLCCYLEGSTWPFSGCFVIVKLYLILGWEESIGLTVSSSVFHSSPGSRSPEITYSGMTRSPSLFSRRSFCWDGMEGHWVLVNDHVNESDYCQMKRDLVVASNGGVGYLYTVRTWASWWLFTVNKLILVICAQARNRARGHLCIFPLHKGLSLIYGCFIIPLCFQGPWHYL